jgi:hypothetical protein
MDQSIQTDTSHSIIDLGLLEMDDCTESLECGYQRSLIWVFIFLTPGVQERHLDGEVLGGICCDVWVACADFEAPLEFRGAFHLVGLGFQIITFF